MANNTRLLILPGVRVPIAAKLPLKQRQRSFPESQFIEALLRLRTVGGDGPEDIQWLAGDACLERGLGFALPKVSALRTFLERFHDPALAAQRPPRPAQKSFIVPSSAPVPGLQEVPAGLIGRVARLCAAPDRALTIATVDQDATIIASHPQAALAQYDGGRGYQPLVAVWAEADLVLADEFRDGNMRAWAEALPSRVKVQAPGRIPSAGPAPVPRPSLGASCGASTPRHSVRAARRRRNSQAGTPAVPRAPAGAVRRGGTRSAVGILTEAHAELLLHMPQKFGVGASKGFRRKI